MPGAPAIPAAPATHATPSRSPRLMNRPLARIDTTVSIAVSTAISSANWPKLTVGLSFIQAILMTVLQDILIISLLGFTNAVFTTTTSGFSPYIAVYQGLLIIALFFQLLGSLDAYLLRNSMQVIAVGGFQALIIMYSCAQIVQMYSFRQCVNDYRAIGMSDMNNLTQAAAIWDLEQGGCPFRTINKVNSTFYFTIGDPTTATPRDISIAMSKNMSTIHTSISISYAILVLMLLFTVIGAFISQKTIEIYGWSVFYSHGADLAKREILRRYHLFIVLLKLNVYFSAGIVLQMFSALYFSQTVQTTMSTIPGDVGSAIAPATNETMISQQASARRIVFCIASAIVLFVAVLYYFFGYYGIQRGSRLFMILFFIVMACNMSAVTFAFSEAVFNDLYRVIRLWFSLFVVIQFILNVFTIISAVICMRDFDSGLPEIAKSLGAIKISSSAHLPSMVLSRNKDQLDTPSLIPQTSSPLSMNGVVNSDPTTALTISNETSHTATDSLPEELVAVTTATCERVSISPERHPVSID
ncbi:hypothetical protein BASA60_009668 [Batrachochytrium salamandrivorans]|nr:hypothetical protein BASA60_009668 [Batrachochytrium salamandrivorans]KAH9272094.1 hypothetical protein BASA83_005683 [Batrachochytrium salamandrivorans]